MMLSNALILVAAGLLLFAALHDIGFRTIPDWVSAALAADGSLLRLLDHRLPAAVACGLAVFALAAICWRRGWLGGGDVKLLAATSVLVPPGLVPGYILAVALTGGVLAVIYLLLERIVPFPSTCPSASFFWRVLVVECRRIRKRMSLPYATAISIAALLTLIKG